MFILSFRWFQKPPWFHCCLDEVVLQPHMDGSVSYPMDQYDRPVNRWFFTHVAQPILKSSSLRGNPQEIEGYVYVVWVIRIHSLIDFQTYSLNYQYFIIVSHFPSTFHPFSTHLPMVFQRFPTVFPTFFGKKWGTTVTIAGQPLHIVRADERCLRFLEARPREVPYVPWPTKVMGRFELVYPHYGIIMGVWIGLFMDNDSYNGIWEDFNWLNMWAYHIFMVMTNEGWFMALF